jgi:hypothetical protein
MLDSPVSLWSQVMHLTATFHFPIITQANASLWDIFDNVKYDIFFLLYQFFCTDRRLENLRPRSYSVHLLYLPVV